MNNINQKTTIQNETGTAMVETLPLLIIFIVLFSYSLGFFGVVHTAILNSMASRTYAFETFSQRSDTILFRDRAANGLITHYKNFGNRFHTIDSENKPDEGADAGQYATTRSLVFGRRIPASDANETTHNIKIYDIVGRNRKGGVEVSPAWIMVGYGLCIDAKCGGEN